MKLKKNDVVMFDYYRTKIPRMGIIIQVNATKHALIEYQEDRFYVWDDTPNVTNIHKIGRL